MAGNPGSLCFSLHHNLGDGRCRLLARAAAFIDVLGFMQVDRFEVHELYRGKGYGKALLQLVETKALSVLCPATTMVIPGCTSAGQEFFSSQGFTCDDYYKGVWYTDL